MLTFFCPFPSPHTMQQTEKGRLVASLSLGPTEKRVAMGDALNDDLWHSFRFKFKIFLSHLFRNYFLIFPPPLP